MIEDKALCDDRYVTTAHSRAWLSAAIYALIGETPFDHDAEKIEFDAPDAGEFDERIGMPGVHTVSKRVQFNHRQTILSPDLFR